MSSPMKDARWNLARKMLATVGFDYDGVSYPTMQVILDAAQMILNENPEMIEPEAKGWNTHESPTD